MAAWMAGSEASGLTVATYRSVLVTWLRVQIAATDSGASTQPTTISSVATMVRHRCRPPPAAVGRPALPPCPCPCTCERRVVTSARSRSSSVRSSMLSVVSSAIGGTVLPLLRTVAPAASPIVPGRASPTVGDSWPASTAESPIAGDDRPPGHGQDPAMTRNVGYGTGGSPFKPASQQPALHRLVPVSQHLPGYQGSTFRRDLLAGLTVAALALPAAMAYAELAGLSPVAGLYALLLPTIAYTLFGSSRQLIVGPEGSIAALVATALVPLAADDPGRYASLAALLALLVGACFLVARVIRLGWVADYFSRAVLIGYLHGVAVVLVIGQLAKLLGLDIDARDPLAQLAEVVRKLPGALLVVVAAIAASAALGLAAEGVATVGEIPSGLPGLALPTAPLGDLLVLVPAALGIFFVSFSDEILTARSFAGHHGQHVSADTELTAMGAASLAAGITQGFPIGASSSRTAVNDQMGARTQLSGLLGAGAIAVVLLFLTEPMQYLPTAALGAVIVAASARPPRRPGAGALVRVRRRGPHPRRRHRRGRPHLTGQVAPGGADHLRARPPQGPHAPDPPGSRGAGPGRRAPRLSHRPGRRRGGHRRRGAAMSNPSYRGPASSPPRPKVDAGRLWTGGVATAAVAALVAVVGVLIARGLFDVPLLAPTGEGALGD